MNASTLTRIKWGLAILGVLVSVTAYHNKVTSAIEAPAHSAASAGKVPSEEERLDAVIPRGLADYPYYAWEPHPVVELQSNYLREWKRGEIALRAISYLDKVHKGSFERSKPGQQTLVLINDTDDSLGVPSEDGDIYIKLEVKLGEKWSRAQYHGYSWCGNSYRILTLPPHSYVPVLGYQPTTGRLATSRFAVKNGAKDVLLSPEFEGVYSPDDVAMSAFDQLALGESSLHALKAFLLRKEVPILLWHNQSISQLRSTAWQAILGGSHDPGEALTIAREVLAFDPSLESHPELVEQMLKARHTTRETTQKGEHRMHGFTINK